MLLLALEFLDGNLQQGGTSFCVCVCLCVESEHFPDLLWKHSTFRKKPSREYRGSPQMEQSLTKVNDIERVVCSQVGGSRYWLGLTWWWDLGWCVGAPIALCPCLWNGHYDLVLSWDGPRVPWVHVHKMLKAVLGTLHWIGARYFILCNIVIWGSMVEVGEEWPPKCDSGDNWSSLHQGGVGWLGELFLDSVLLPVQNRAMD